jgi:hypothetical protein
LQNFWGWWLTVFTTFALYLWLFGKEARPAMARFDRLALGSYLVTCLGIVIAALISEAGALALIGFFAMIPWGIAGWLKISLLAAPTINKPTLSGVRLGEFQSEIPFRPINICMRGFP